MLQVMQTGVMTATNKLVFQESGFYAPLLLLQIITVRGLKTGRLKTTSDWAKFFPEFFPNNEVVSHNKRFYNM